MCAGCCPAHGARPPVPKGAPSGHTGPPLTVVMHGCPHKAAVGLGQGLISACSTRKVWRALVSLDSSVFVYRLRSSPEAGTTSASKTRNVATTVPCKHTGASQGPESQSA